MHERGAAYAIIAAGARLAPFTILISPARFGPTWTVHAMNMEQIQEFVVNHPLLWGALVIVLIAAAANELFRNLKGQAPIPASEAVRLMNTEDAIVVDTRSAADFKKSHILNARHVPMAGIEERAGEISKNTDRSIICYCGIGNVAPQAAAKLRKLGYSRAHALKGGINAWQADGMPVTSK
jgi:rhodanese-related sulfurtransferase